MIFSAAHTSTRQFQTPSLKSNPETFFATLPQELMARVKNREGIRSVRVLTNEETGGSVAVKIFSTQHVEPAHVHFETKQIFIVLAGELMCWKDTTAAGRIEHTLKCGDIISIEPGELHGFSGNALVGGVDIGKGTALDEFPEQTKVNFAPAISLSPFIPITQGLVKRQTLHYEQRELLNSVNSSIQILSETMTSTFSSRIEAKRLVVVVSGEAKVAQKESIQKLQAGDFFFLEANECCIMTTISPSPVVTISFVL